MCNIWSYSLYLNRHLYACVHCNAILVCVCVGTCTCMYLHIYTCACTPTSKCVFERVCCSCLDSYKVKYHHLYSYPPPEEKERSTLFDTNAHKTRTHFINNDLSFRLLASLQLFYSFPMSFISQGKFFYIIKISVYLPICTFAIICLLYFLKHSSIDMAKDQVFTCIHNHATQKNMIMGSWEKLFCLYVKKNLRLFVRFSAVQNKHASFLTTLCAKAKQMHRDQWSGTHYKLQCSGPEEAARHFTYCLVCSTSV